MSWTEFFGMLGISLIVTLCVTMPLFGFERLTQMDINDKTRDRIELIYGYEIDYISSLRYADNWFYVWVAVYHVENGSVGSDLLRYNIDRDIYKFDELDYIKSYTLE